MTATQQYAANLSRLPDEALRARCLEAARCYLRHPRGEEGLRNWHFCAIARDECRRRGRPGWWDEALRAATAERRQAKSGGNVPNKSGAPKTPETPK